MSADNNLMFLINGGQLHLFSLSLSPPQIQTKSLLLPPAFDDDVDLGTRTANPQAEPIHSARPISVSGIPVLDKKRVTSACSFSFSATWWAGLITTNSEFIPDFDCTADFGLVPGQYGQKYITDTILRVIGKIQCCHLFKTQASQALQYKETRNMRVCKTRLKSHSQMNFLAPVTQSKWWVSHRYVERFVPRMWSNQAGQKKKRIIQARKCFACFLS